jgi:hypothetical protein
MSVLPDTRAPLRRPDVLEIDLGDGLIIYDREADLVHRLNPSAATVWRLCNGVAPVGELVGTLVDHLGVPPSEVKAQILGLLEELDELGLMEDASARPVTTREKGVTSTLTEVRAGD